MHYKEYKRILGNKNNMNIYRGCTHGCIYCDSRSLCYQLMHNFEDIEVKTNAPKQLEEELRRKRKPCMIVTGSMTDPYMPLEGMIMYTRRCLEAIEKYSFGVAPLTKSNLILRDLELLKKINKKAKCVVQITLSTYDEELCKILEPNVCTTKERFETLKIFNENEIPTVVWLGPFLPFLTDTKENLLGLLDYCERAHVYGIINFGIGLTLRDGNREYFYKCLDKYFPGMKEKYQKKFGNEYHIHSDNSQELMDLFHTECRKRGIESDINKVFEYVAEYPKIKEQVYVQLSLF